VAEEEFVHRKCTASKKAWYCEGGEHMTHGRVDNLTSLDPVN